MFNVSWLYVGGLYAAAVWLARRAGIDLRRRIALFFYLLVFIFLHTALTTDAVNLPMDFLRTLPPWALLTRDHHTLNPEINDLVLQIVPWAHQVRESWRSLDLPLWNHLAGSGYPLLANAQSSALSLLRLLALPLPLGQSFAAEAAMKILIALTFTYLFCRRRGYSELASAAGAICFGFCSFVIVWLHFPLGTVSVFVPAALYQIDLLAERRTFGRFSFAAGLWTTMIFGGHPETVAHIFFICLLYVLWIVLVERPFPTWKEAGRFVVTLGGALVVAGLLAAPFLAPVAEALAKSKRYHELQVNPNVIGYYSDWYSFIVLLQPHFYGRLPFEKSWGPATAESITGFAGVLGIAAWFALAMELVWTRRWRSREAFFVLATLIILGIILAWPVISDLFHLVLKMAANARLRLLFCFCLAVMTAAMLDLIERAKGPAGVIYLTGVMISAAVLLYLVKGETFANAWERDTALLAVLPSAMVLLIAALVALAAHFRVLVMAVLMVAVIAELWTVSREWNPNVREAMMYPKTPLIEALTEMAKNQKEPFRIVGTGADIFPNTSAMYGLEDIRAHDPMANGRYLGTLRVLTGYDTDDYFAKWQNIETSLLDYLNVRYVVTNPWAELQQQGRFSLVYQGRDGRIFESRSVLPRFYPVRNVILEFRHERYLQLLKQHNDWANTAILENLPVENDQMRNDMLSPRPAGSSDPLFTILSAERDRYRMRIVAPRYTLVVSSIPWWPGWKVVRDGQRINPIRANGAFLSFAVPPGGSDVEIYYQPMSFWLGVSVSFATVIALAVGRVLAHSRQLTAHRPPPREL